MPLKTDRLTRRSSKEAIQKAISADIATMMREWEELGKIGTSHPGSKEEAQKQAAAIAYANARRNAGGAKVPRK